MRTVTTRRKVREQPVYNQTGHTTHVVLTTYRNSDIEVTIDFSRPDSIDITKRPTRLTDEQSRCLVSILQHAQKMLEPDSADGK